MIDTEAFLEVQLSVYYMTFRTVCIRMRSHHFVSRLHHFIDRCYAVFEDIELSGDVNIFV